MYKGKGWKMKLAEFILIPLA